MKIKIGFGQALFRALGFHPLFIAAFIALIPAASYSANDLLAIRFINNDIGFVSGKIGYLSKTTDAGLTWTTVNTRIREDILDICPLGEEVLLAACSNGKVYKTTDGGSTWELKMENSSADLKCIFFTYDSRLILCGKNSSLYTSIDFGETWETISVPVQANLNKIFFLNGLEGYITGSNSTLLITEDGGASWTLKTFGGYRYNFTSISMLDNKTGLISGDGGVIFNTTNGWISWKKYDVPSQSNDLYDVKYLNNSTALTIGSNYILKTSDNGRNWLYVDLPVPISYYGTFSKIYFTSQTNGFIIGTNNIKLSTTDQGVTWRYILEKTENDRNNTAIGHNPELRNYPNPFNPGTMISYSLPSDGLVKLKVYDITGREVISLVDEYKASGSYTARFTAPSGLSSGIYYYTLSINSNGQNIVKTQKMLLIK